MALPGCPLANGVDAAESLRARRLLPVPDLGQILKVMVDVVVKFIELFAQGNATP